MKIYFQYFFIIIFMSCNTNSSSTKIKHNNNTISEKEKNHKNDVFQDAQQLVLVISPNDSSIHAKLWRFENIDSNWKAVKESIDVNLGRTGLAWGSGLHADVDTIHKKEGDGKSPMGIFSFGTAFGYADASAGNALFKLPYTPIDKHTQCIEDANSQYYNQIINNQTIQQDWSAADFMRREDNLYKWGVFIHHNTPAKPSAGSCIFFHLWRGADKPTAGCTAMTEENILVLMKWLDPEKHPLLVQLTANQYQIFKKNYPLPELTL